VEDEFVESRRKDEGFLTEQSELTKTPRKKRLQFLVTGVVNSEEGGQKKQQRKRTK